MMEKNLPRLLIGATGSGCGKTTFTCGLLQALCDRGKIPAAFKCGPDYIDPMFHTEALGVHSRNLDLFFSEIDTVNYLLAKPSADIAIIEGVMGYYDGLAGISNEASAHDLATKTQTPAILLVDARGRSVSILAEVKGFLELEQDSQIKGIILNQISDMLYPDIKRLIEEALQVKVYGYLPKMDDCSLESRHLGLVTAREIGNLKEILNKISKQIAATVDVDRLLELAEESPPITYHPPELHPDTGASIRIGIAMDKAFCFYYWDNLDLLKDLGAELVPFSPLEDDNLPDDLQGLILGGGYPELYLEQLSSNVSMRSQIKDAVKRGAACLAECGGFMYLHDEIKDKGGRAFPMAGVVEGSSYPTGKLSRFGYISMTAREDTLLCKKGGVLKGHEFHYWDSTNTGRAFHAQKPLRKRNWDCMIARGNLLAGYPHVYLTAEMAECFIRRCKKGV